VPAAQGLGSRFTRYKWAVKRVVPLAVLVLAVAACGSTQHRKARAAPAKPSCPAAWRTGWQKVANRAGAAVYCPSWMPQPIDGHIGGPYTDINEVSKDHSYLVSFVWFEPGAGEVHVNFRGYPGRIRIPTCSDLDTNKPVPCFSDLKGSVHAGAITARVYTANQGIDQWHVLYLWRRGHSLYTLSEHIAPPYTYNGILHNLNRMLQGLVLVKPTA
jgi:hypothetical protein